jgi:hypothetical protein
MLSCGGANAVPASAAALSNVSSSGDAMQLHGRRVPAQMVRTRLAGFLVVAQPATTVSRTASGAPSSTWTAVRSSALRFSSADESVTYGELEQIAQRVGHEFGHDAQAMSLHRALGDREQPDDQQRKAAADLP